MSGQTTITESLAGEVAGAGVHRYLLANAAGMSVEILSYGGTISRLEAPDRDGNLANVVLGFATLEEYVDSNANPTVVNPGGSGVYFGSIIGRYANRIAGGTFELDGVAYEVPRNEGSCALHGGDVGFDQRVFSAAVVEGEQGPALRLEYESRAGEMGFPGTLLVVATYRLDPENRLSLELRATSDAATIVNLTNHTYWNLAGESSGSALDQLLTVHAGRYLPVDEVLVPTGELRHVDATPFDFRRPAPIASRIREADGQLALGHGYDHNYVLDSGPVRGAGASADGGGGAALVSGSVQGGERGPALAASALDPGSGRGLRLYTTQPGMQLYSGNFLDGSVRGTGGRLYRQGDGFALETQHFPDSPNHPEFPSTVLRPGARYEETIVFELFVDDSAGGGSPPARPGEATGVARREAG
ncbi:MAG TPA: aldose epimerase family protein [Acidimicrobiales bacterium]|nr:aldose epimerase family protein [Acidimicrobiales bacterium]